MEDTKIEQQKTTQQTVKTKTTAQYTCAKKDGQHRDDQRKAEQHKAAPRQVAEKKAAETKMPHRKALEKKTAFTKGQEAEGRVRSFLENRGWRCVASRFRCKYGEIDLIMEIPQKKPQQISQQTPIEEKSKIEMQTIEKPDIVAPGLRAHSDMVSRGKLRGKLVFIEVKTRHRFRDALECLGPHQCQRIINAALFFMANHGEEAWHSYQIDLYIVHRHLYHFPNILSLIP